MNWTVVANTSFRIGVRKLYVLDLLLNSQSHPGLNQYLSKRPLSE